MIPAEEEDLQGRGARGEVIERAPVYGWARRTLFGGGGSAGRFTRTAMTPLAWVWGAAAMRRLTPGGGAVSDRLTAPVVSVGNVTLGGGGKTSLVEWIVRRGRPPEAVVAVLTRGYGRSGDVAVALAPGTADGPVVKTGDEPALLARAGAWVGVAADRRRGASAVTALGGRPDLFVLDDGLQNRSLPRALDLVVFGAGDLTAPARCVPAGPLRQPSAWRPPHPVWVVVGADPREREWPAGSIGRAYASWWRDLPGTSARWRHEPPVTLRAWSAGGREPFDPGARPVVAFAGVARPSSVGDSAREAGHDPSALLAFPDHHAYGPDDVADLLREHPEAAFLTTEKDAVKLDAAWFSGAPVGVLSRRLAPDDPDLLEREIADAMGWPS